MPGKKSLTYKILDAYRVMVRVPADMIAKLVPAKQVYADGEGHAFTANGCAVVERGAGWRVLVPFDFDGSRAMADLAALDATLAYRNSKASK